MADINFDQQEQEFRRRWYEAHLRRFKEETREGEGHKVAKQETRSEANSATFLEFITGEGASEASEKHKDVLDDLGAVPEEFQKVAAWWVSQEPIVVHPVLLDRCALRFPYGGRDFNEDLPGLKVNSRALMRVEQHIGTLLEGEVAKVFHGRVKLALRGVDWGTYSARGHLQISWQAPEQYAPGLWIWANSHGMTICLAPGIGPYRGKGGERRWYDELIGALPDREDSDFELIGISGGKGENRGFMGRHGSSVYGAWYERESLRSLDLREEFQRVIPKLRPVFDKWLDLYREQANGPGTRNPPPEDRLALLAKKLRVDLESIQQIVGLLEDKGQVIFYGPPGTGKTYLAKKLAECVAPEGAQRAFVQFHPSMSYEDFFEGYRPETGADGSMTYKLTPGPLRNIAEAAGENPDQQHILIIDEINRANLPKVLGELLFLLEYREDTVLPLYRPQEPFGLPSNLWLIGTMNTADRSIAPVDVALRRRFHFVPFFPHQGMMEGLLERWLQDKGEKAWVGELVAEVNRELSQALGGPHLQLGPSHFMKDGISELTNGKLEMVWRYTVEPFIEEQFFDDPDRIGRFRWKKIKQEVASEEPVPVKSPPDENSETS